MSQIETTARKAMAVALLMVAVGALSAGGAAADNPVGELSRKKTLDQESIDATRWGEDIRNPFTNLTAEGKAKLKAEGVDVARLVKLRAVLVTGHPPRRLFNNDPNTILVLGKGFAHDNVYSAGPILAVEDAYSGGRLTGEGLVWFVEKAWPRMRARGAPLLAAMETSRPHVRETEGALRRGDYGWRRPVDFLEPPSLKAGAKLPPLAASDADKKKKDLQDLIKSRSGEDVAEWGDEVVNPFKNLSPEGRAKLAARGIDARRLRKLKAFLLADSDGDGQRRNFINRDPDAVLVLGKHFSTNGEIFSLGPVLVVENAHFRWDIHGADLVWFVEQSMPNGRTAGLPVILAPTTQYSRIIAETEDVWHGDYGWRRLDDFLDPVSLKLTSKELDALWRKLDAGGPSDADRRARTVRKLLAAETFLPYLKQRLRLPPRPAGERVDRLLDELDSDRYPTREAASRELKRLGMLVEPNLRFVLNTRPTLEVRRRIEDILEGVKSERRRIRRAFQAIGEMDPLGSRAFLEDLAQGDDDWFPTREAKAVLNRKNHKRRP